MSGLRAGLVGAGMMGRNHMRVLSGLGGVDLVGVVDTNPDVALPPEVRRVPSVEQLLDLGIDYAVVAAPTATHRRIAELCADAGVHVLVEKPLTTDADQAQRLAALFRERALIGAVGHIERYNPALRQAKLRMARGDLGEVYQVTTSRQGPFPGRIADVGVILDLASHDFDLTAWITGSRYTDIFARTAHRSGRAHEDLVTASGQLESGTITSHLVNWVSSYKERLTIMTGEKGTLVANTLTADLTLHENGVVRSEWQEMARFRGVTEGNMTRFAFAKPEPLVVEHECFRDAVLGISDDIVTFEEGAATVTVAQACARSAASGQSISLAGSQ